MYLRQRKDEEVQELCMGKRAVVVCHGQERRTVTMGKEHKESTASDYVRRVMETPSRRSL